MLTVGRFDAVELLLPSSAGLNRVVEREWAEALKVEAQLRVLESCVF